MRQAKSFWWILTLTVALFAAIVLTSVWGYQQYIAIDPDRSSGRHLVPVDPAMSTSSDSLANILKKIQELNASLDQIIAQQEERYRDDVASLQHRRIILDSLRQEINPNAIAEPARPVTNKNALSGPIMVSSIDLLTLKKNRSTSREASDVTVFQGSFYLKASSVTSGELYVLIRKPDGSLLIPRDAKPQPGKQHEAFSVKIPFDSANERISFSLRTPPLVSGIYTVEVYYRNRLIGSLQKELT